MTGGQQPLKAGEQVALDSEVLADRIVTICSDRKAIDLAVVDVRGMVGYTDFLIVCSGNTERQTKAIHDAVYRTLKDELALLPTREEGVAQARWILVDYLDCVLHVFTPEAREYYRLENLWGDAPRRAVDC